MGRDFYAILGVNRNAKDNEIRKAYKKLAVKWHPDKNPENKEEATKKFKEISEAYEILSNPEKKKLYDQFGEEGVNPKVNDGGFGNGGFSGFSDQRAQDIFSQVFGGKGGFFNFGNGGNGGVHFTMGGDEDEEDHFGGMGGMGGFNFPGFGGMGGMGGFGREQQRTRKPKKPPTVTHDLYFTLEELYTGLTKKVKITRNIVNDDGRSTRTESEVKAFDVRPGWKSGTKVTFEGAGDQPSKDAPPGDIVFVIQEKPHHNFKRSGDDLIHTANIPLRDALCGGTYSLTHLDGTTIRVPLTNVITPGSVTTIAGKGMPISRNPSQKGNLKITFNVIFPTQISENQKNELKKIL